MGDELRDATGRYACIQQDDVTADDPVGNFVFYDTSTTPWHPVADRRSYEAGQAPAAPSRPTPPQRPDPPPQRPDPPPARPSTPVPPATGPLPGGKRVLQVTNESDGTIIPRMMSDRANAIVEDTIGAAFVFCGTAAGPRFFMVDLRSGTKRRLGQLVPYGGETEGWYWTKEGRVVLPSGPRLISVNPFNPGDVQTLIDISETRPGCDLWQPHSSDDGRVHSATVRQIVSEGKYPYVGTVIQGPWGQLFQSARGVLDESQVSRSGSHVVIKDNGEDNLIVNPAEQTAVNLPDAEGAIGHSDCGPTYIVGESNLPGPGRCVKMDLYTLQRLTLFETDNMGYVSVRGGICLHSDDEHLSLVSLTGAGRVVLLAHGATGLGNYDNRPKANLDPTGRLACYMTNAHGRRDVFLYVLP